MHQQTPSREVSQAEELRHHLTRAAVIVVVLGVLPFAWGAGAAWQATGAVVTAAVGGRALQLVWRAVFSTDPRHFVGG